MNEFPRSRSRIGDLVALFHQRFCAACASLGVIHQGAQSLARHDSIDRESFMPGVLLAVRRIGYLDKSPVVGLENLL